MFSSEVLRDLELIPPKSESAHLPHFYRYDTDSSLWLRMRPNSSLTLIPLQHLYLRTANVQIVNFATHLDAARTLSTRRTKPNIRTHLAEERAAIRAQLSSSVAEASSPIPRPALNKGKGRAIESPPAFESMHAGSAAWHTQQLQELQSSPDLTGASDTKDVPSPPSRSLLDTPCPPRPRPRCRTGREFGGRM